MYVYLNESYPIQHQRSYVGRVAIEGIWKRKISINLLMNRNMKERWICMLKGEGSTRREKGYLKSFFNKSHILSTSKFYLRQAIWVKFVSSKNEVGKYLIQIIPFLSIVPSNHISCNLNKVEHIWEFQDIPLFLISFLNICYNFILCQICRHFFVDHTYHIMHLTEHVWLITFFFQLCLVPLQREILL